MAKTVKVKRKSMLGPDTTAVKRKSAKVNTSSKKSAGFRSKDTAVKRKSAKVKTSSKKKAVFPDTAVSGKGSQFDPNALTAVPLGEAVDVTQQRVRNAVQTVPDIQSVFSLETGFGVANPGETGEAAINRIKGEKKSKRKSKVKKK